MHSNKVLINRTHICALKYNKKERKLWVDLMELKFPFENQYLELKSMAENKNRNICDLESFVKNSKLSCLLYPYLISPYFNYCVNLTGIYQGIHNYSMTNYIDYQKELSEYDILVRKENSPNKIKPIIALKEEFIKSKREGVYDEMKNRRYAYMLEEAYKVCEEDPNIIAFSNRRVGWHFPEFKLGIDFTVIFKTNFGYGSSSYFYTNIRYKNIDILPYSDWIKYKFAKSYDIIRYSRRYQLIDDSWIQTMEFTVEMHNHSVLNPDTFILKYIINECGEMVSGLEDLLNLESNSTYKILDSFFIKNQSIQIRGYELVDFKGEKISGALTFLDKISEIESVSTRSQEFIQRIMNCNLKIYPQLNKNILTLDEVINSINLQIEEILPEWNRQNEENGKFHIIKENILNEEQEKHPELTYTELDQLAEKVITSKFPEYEEKIRGFSAINYIYLDLNKKLNKHRTYKHSFESYVKTIEDHFNTIGVSLD